MNTEPIVEAQTLEELIEAVRALPPRRAAQVLDFARWLQTQPGLDELSNGEESTAELEAEERAWEAAYLARRDEFRAMANEALRELEAGETLEMVVENGKIRPR